MIGKLFFTVLSIGYALADEPDLDETAFNRDCPLDGQTLYGWEVRIYDKTTWHTVAHGSIISLLAVISGCSTFNKSPSSFAAYDHEETIDFTVIGQKLKNMRNFDNYNEWCSQSRNVKQIIPHSKCLLKEPLAPHFRDAAKRAFDFAIFLLDRPFATGNARYYPTITLPITPLRMIMDITSLNVEEEAVCEIPIYKTRNDIFPRYEKRRNSLVKAIPFHSVCIHRYCNFTEDREAEMSCFEFLSSRSNATQLCMHPMWTSKFPVEPLNWYLGAPFSCNGTVYGHAGHLKHGAVIPIKVVNDDGYSSQKEVLQDFWYVPTYLRVWPWLQSAIRRFGVASRVDPVRLYSEDVRPSAIYNLPSRADIPDQILPRRAPRVQLTFPPDKQKIWYRSAASSSNLSTLALSFVVFSLKYTSSL